MLIKKILLSLTFFLWLISNFNINSSYQQSNYDLSVIGIAFFNSAAGRIAIDCVDCLKNDLKINFTRITSNNNNNSNINSKVLSIINNNEKKPGNVILYLYPYCGKFWVDEIHKEEHFIKIAYSIFETNRIPQKWVKEFNENFDLVVVPDGYLVNVYKQSGVQVPIFVLPQGLQLDEFLKIPKKTTTKKKFIFGCASTFGFRKNNKMLVRAFIQEFGNNESVKLKLNGLVMQTDAFKEVMSLIKESGVKNIEVNPAIIPWKKYITFLSSIDCYVTLSRGEGFSVPPREIMALGIPCILSNNTAQKTICDTGFVRPVKSDILEKAVYFPELFGDDIGCFFNCTIEDAREALRDVYNNYNKYLILARKGREWVKKYDWKNLKERYLTLVKPKKIIFGKFNLITDKYLMTNSKELYEKYKKVIKNAEFAEIEGA